MAPFTKNHFVPAFIIRNFSDSDQDAILRISLLHKATNKVIKNIPAVDQCQKRNLYYKDSLKNILKKFSHITLNPIFEDDSEDLETSLSRFIENPFSSFCRMLLEKKNPARFLLKNEQFIREYIIIQFLRCNRFKDSISKMKVEIPQKQFIELLKQEVIKNSILSEEQVLHMLSTEKYASLLQKYVTEIKNKIDDFQDHDGRHTAEVISKGTRDSFFNKYGLQQATIKLIINTTPIPFVLSDAGVLTVEHVKVYPSGIVQKDMEFYLPISPKIMIMFSKGEDLPTTISKEQIQEINRISYKECLNTIYSSDSEYLKSLAKKRS